MNSITGNSAAIDAITKLQWLDIDYAVQQLEDTTIELFSKYLQTREPRSHEAQLMIAHELVAKTDSPMQLRLNRWFDVAQYLELRQDVKRAQINPYLHFFSIGYKEHEWPELFGLRSEYVKKLRIKEGVGKAYTSPEELKERWNSHRSSPLLRSVADLSNDIIAASRGLQQYIVSFSHDDAYVNTGGIQKIIREESSASIDHDICYIHICPSMPHLYIDDLLGDQGRFSLCNVRVNGDEIGCMLQRSIPLLLGKLAGKKITISIHHFFGFNIGLALSRLSRRGGRVQVFYWAHDYSACCQSYTLLMDHHEFCESPRLPSVKCDYCSFGSRRSEYLEKVRTLFATNDVTVVFPSQAASDQFNLGKSAMPPNTKQIVLPHIKILSYSLEATCISARKQKIIIAYVGTPARHKGFDEFTALARDPILAEYFEWIHIGRGDHKMDLKSFYADGIGNSSTREVLSANKVDIAFIWPIWPETFCFVAYEALSAGCHIVTNTLSGNIAKSLPDQTFTAFDTIDQVKDWLLSDLAIGKKDIIYGDNILSSESTYTLGLIS